MNPDSAVMSQSSVIDTLKVLMPCDGDTCCCIPRRSTVIIISIINFFGCILDLMSGDTCLEAYCEARELVDSFRKLLLTLFQIANLLLLLATLFGIAALIDIYVWFTLGYIVMGFVVTISEFAVKVKRDGARSLLTFIPEVVFLFVIFRCLPLVDMYRRHLYSQAAATTEI